MHGRESVQTFDWEMGKRLVMTAAWLAYAMPVGDSVRAGIPALFAKIRALLANEKLIWPLGYMWSDHKERKDLFDLLKVVGGDEVKLPNDEEDVCEQARDDGALIVAIYARSLLAGFGPADCGSN